jgi:ribonuclease P protein subunit RPR2
MPRGRKGKRTKGMVKIAGERIDILFNLAEEEALIHNLHRADRYVELARKIGMRYNVRIPRRYRRRYCKHCHCYFLPSVNCRIRVRGNNIVIFCENCGRYTRMPLNREKKNMKGKKEG